MDGLPEPTKPALPSTEANDAPPRRPSLLPAFEPLSSSPGLPRPAKRKLDDILDDRKYYPTPVPTSSTGILPSSPPSRLTRPGIQRTVSALSERAPLGDVPSLDLPANGEPVLMGRSSNSSDYQLSANRHISRVHVRASYLPPDEVYPNGKVEVECLGWNGAKVHCRGEIVELAKGELFESGKPMAQIIVDVQDTRVMLNWPRDSRDPPSIGSQSPWNTNSPSKRQAASVPQFASSPPAMLAPRPASPVSPTPGQNGLNFNVGVDTTFTSTFRADGEPVKVYQDHDSDEDAPHDPTPEPNCGGTPTPKRATTMPERDVNQSTATLASEQEELSDHDEENDPIVHSFGPFGDNIMSRFQSFQSTSPERKRKPLKSTFNNSPGRGASTRQVTHSPVKNHVINQLAFSRIHALPLSTIHSNLPAELRGAMAKPSDNENPRVMTTSDLKTILDGIPCVGEISREGKDAAGKLLESEFYYVPEMDVDVNRRDTVMQSLGKTGIRAARKQHKVCCSHLVSPSPMTDSFHSNTTGNVHAIEPISGSMCSSAHLIAHRYRLFLLCRFPCIAIVGYDGRLLPERASFVHLRGVSRRIHGERMDYSLNPSRTAGGLCFDLCFAYDLHRAGLLGTGLRVVALSGSHSWKSMIMDCVEVDTDKNGSFVFVLIALSLLISFRTGLSLSSLR